MKAFFLSRLLREKILLVLFVLIAALIWVTSVTARTNVFWRSFSRTSSDLDDQHLVLTEQKAIAARAKAAVEKFDASKTLDGVRLQGELYAIANAAGVANPIIDNSQAESSAGDVKLNTVQFSIRNVEYGRLVDFYEALSKRAPYIGIEQISIRSSPTATSQLSASLKVSSVQIGH
jgi:hypothetical protein